MTSQKLANVLIGLKISFKANKLYLVNSYGLINGRKPQGSQTQNYIRAADESGKGSAGWIEETKIKRCCTICKINSKMA